MRKLLSVFVALAVVLPITSQALVIQQPPTDDTPTGTTGSYYCPQLSSTIQRGARDASTGGQVTELQTFLTDYFDLDESTSVSGFFGRTTQKYLALFQQKNGLPAYGIAGTLTRAKIAEVCKNGSVGDVCPVYDQPLCKTGETVVIDVSSAGCKVPRCAPERPTACTMDYAPVCGKPAYCMKADMSYSKECDIGKTYSNKCMLGADGAQYMYSGECKDKPVACPVYQVPRCGDGMQLVKGERTSSGCDGAPRCVPKKTICPVYNRPICAEGTTLVGGGTSADGCELPPRCSGTISKCGVNSFAVQGARCDVQTQTSANGASAAVAMRVMPPTDASYTSATFTCYDGYTETMGGDSSCKPSSTWQKYAQEKCAGHCSGTKIPVVNSTQGASSYDAVKWVVDSLQKLVK